MTARPLRRLSEFVFAVGVLVGAVVFCRVFSLDLSRFGDVVLARVIVFLGVVGATMTILVNFMRLVGTAQARSEETEDSLPSK